MLILYGGYSISWVLSGTGSPGPVLLSADMSGLSDGRSGSGTAFKWGGGVQTTSSNVVLTGTITSPLDATAPIGGVGVVNLQGLPAGTLIDIAGGAYSQRLIAGRRSELSSWILPTAALNNNTIAVRIWNNVNGAPTIPALATFAIGEIIAGRLASLPTLIGESAPEEQINDPSAFKRSAGNQLWQLMRKPFGVPAAKFGRFATIDAKGGSKSRIQSGGNPASTIDVRTLMYLLSTTPVCAVCDTPHEFAPLPSTKTAGGFLFDATMANLNFMLARPSNIQPLRMDPAPLWTCGATFMEAT